MVRPILAFERFLGVLSRYLAFCVLVVLEKGSPEGICKQATRRAESSLGSSNIFAMSKPEKSNK